MHSKLLRQEPSGMLVQSVVKQGMGVRARQRLNHHTGVHGAASHSDFFL